MFLTNVFISLLSKEEYLFEYDFMNPFIVPIYEGFFGYFISLILLFDVDYFNDALVVYKTTSVGNFTLFIILLINFLCFLCGIKNMFKMVTLKLYLIGNNFKDIF